MTTLKEQVIYGFDFFQRAVDLLQNMDDHVLSATIENEYVDWFDRGKKAMASALRTKESFVYPSLAVEIVSRVAMLRPLAFATHRSVSSLVLDVRKSEQFMREILNNRATLDDLVVDAAIKEYFEFIRLAGRLEETSEMSEPSLVVDLVWHSHMQLDTHTYLADCIRLAGRVVDHVF